jgi:hypothetical protein
MLSNTPLGDQIRDSRHPPKKGDAPVELTT